MKKKIIAVSLLLSVTANAQTMDLQSAIKQAISVSDESKIALLKRDTSKFDVTIANSAFLPQISLTGSATRSRKILQQDITEDALNSLVLTYNLFNGGIDILAYNVAKLNEAKAKTEFYSSMSDIIISTAELYFKILSEAELLNSYEVAEKRAQVSMKIEQTRFESGVSNKISYLKAESAYYNFRSLRIKSEALVHSLNTEFTRMVGTVPPALLPIPRLDFVTMPKTLSESILQAKSKNPDLLIAVLDAVIAAKEAEMASNAGYPTIDFQSSMGSDINNKQSWSAGVQYNIPLYTGNKITSNTGKAELNKKLKQQVLSKKRSEVNAGVLTAWENYLSSQDTNISSEKALFASAMIKEATGIRYDSGEVSVSELLEIEEEYLLIKKRYYEALSDCALAKLNLLNITGGLKVGLFSDSSAALNVK